LLLLLLLLGAAAAACLQGNRLAALCCGLCADTSKYHSADGKRVLPLMAGNAHAPVVPPCPSRMLL
jgi:hypothetical protein